MSESPPFPPPGVPVSWTLAVEVAGERLDVWLAGRLKTLSRSRLQRLIEAGRVTVDGHSAFARDKTVLGQRVVVTIPPAAPAIPQPEALPLDVIYEDGDMLVLNKPAGLVVHPAPGHAAGTLVNALLHHCDDLAGIGGVERPGIVHRLDRETSGLLVVAKHDAAHQALAAQFQQGRVRKIYLALVHGVPERRAGRIETTIGRHSTDRKRMAANPPHGKPAVSHYETAATRDGLTLLKVRIETGRTHQIRVHLSHIGLPIVGDPVYGSRARDARVVDCPARQMLHATELELDHPADGRRLRFTAPPPADMLDLLRRIGCEQDWA